MVSINNILLLKKSDTLSLIVYQGCLVFMVSYFLYVAVITILRHYASIFYDGQRKFFGRINAGVNLYFALFLQFFFTFFVEINSSFIFCSLFSLLSENRKTSGASGTCSISVGQQIVGIIGLILTGLTAWIVSYFYRNYEFLEQNQTKRRSSLLFNVVLINRFLLSLFYAIDFSSIDTIKHVFS